MSKKIIIETKGLSRSYQTYEKPEGIWNSVKGFWDRKYINKVALQPTDISIESGQIVGLVGANGAGKTTLLKLLSGLIHPSSGTATVLGHEPWQRDNEYLRRISILLGQKNQLWWDIPPSDSFSLLARIYDLNLEEAKERVQELAKLLDCTHVLNTQLRRLSLGERMKMEIIGSLLHNPDILFLDEPTIGLDIVAQSTIRNFIAEYVKKRGQTVILTSHYMDDIAKLADRLLLMSKGALVYDGTVQGFMAKTETLQRLVFSLEAPLMQPLPLGDGRELKAGELEYSMQIPMKEMPKVISKITSSTVIHGLKIEEADFEDIIRKFLETESRVLPTRNHH